MTFHNDVTSWSRKRFNIAILCVFVIAALLRFYGQDWDNGHYFHPDERFIATVMDSRLSLPSADELHLLFDPAHSPLNTRSSDEDGRAQEFAYGSLPFIVATVVGTLIGFVTQTDLTMYSNVGEFGRFLTGLVDLGTITFVILFARRSFGDLAAVIAGILAASSVILIQLAHFFTVDTWVTFFTAATLYACLRLAEHFDLRWTLIAGALGGAALATKVSVGVLGIPILVAMAIGAWRVSSSHEEAAAMLGKRLVLAAIPTFAVFAVFEPYAIWRPGPYVDDIRRQWEIVNGIYDIPFTRQFVGTTSGVNEIENLVLWGIAPGFGIAALVATGIGLYWAIRLRDIRYMLLLSWIVPYFFVIASSEARFLRYSAPLVPPLAIMVGHQLSLWWNQSHPGWRDRIVPGSAITAVCGVTLVWALMFMIVYAGTHPRVEASQWIYENVEPGSTITHEIWDDRLPVGLQTGSGDIYEYRGLDLFRDRANEEAVDFIAEFLAEADYIVLSSQRLSHSIPRMPWRYPVQSAYYRLLEQEKLGYELALEATNYPGLGSLRINTLSADESFSVYDHPPVRVYRKAQDLPREEIDLRFAHAAAQPRISQREPPEPTLRLDTPVAQRTANTTSEWSSSVTDRAPVSVVFWIVALALAGIIGLPVATRLFDGFNDHGVGFAPLVGLLGIGILVWLAWSLELARLNVWLVLCSLVAMAAATWAGVGKPRRFFAQLRARWPLVAGSLVAFSVAFGFFLLLRATNPDLWHPVFGGEKPMETAYLNAILQTGEYPPYDPWFADGSINYYYYGFFLLVLMWNLTGIPFEFAFQLSLATIAGFFASGLFSLGSTLAGSVLHTRNTRWLIAGGSATVATVLFAGNLHVLLESLRTRTVHNDFWESTRIVDYAINEFPYFSFLYADVHPHLMAAPVLVLVIGLAYAWIISAGQVDARWILLWVATSAVTAGSLTVINLWDGPTAAVVLLASLSFPLLRCGGFTQSRLLIALAVGTAIAAGSVALFASFYSAFNPQTDGLRTTSAGSSISDWATHFGGLLIPFLVVAAIALYRIASARRFSASFMGYGAFLAAGAVIVGMIVTPSIDAGPEIVLLVALVTGMSALILQVAPGTGDRRDQEIELIMLSPFIAIAGALVPSRPVAAISSILVASFISLYLANRNRSGAILIAITGASASGLVLVADLVFVADHLQNSDWERMNTVFKLYFQSWTLFGIAAASALTWSLHRAFMRLRSRDELSFRWSGKMYTGSAASCFALVALAAAWFAYPLLATSDRLEHQMESSPSGLSLAGHQWMDGGTIQNQAGDVIEFTGDLGAVEWLKANASGNPVVLEASIGAYRGGGSRISSATGLPTILGWEGHQSQQRGGIEVGQRASDVRELYQTAEVDRKRFLLRKYAVDYVVVGDVERYTIIGDVPENGDPDYYSSADGLETFDAMADEGDLEVVFQSDNTIIYRVPPFPAIGNSR